MLKRLWFANSLAGRTLNVLNQRIDTLEGFLIRFLPIQVVLPGMLREDKPHSLFAKPPFCPATAFKFGDGLKESARILWAAEQISGFLQGIEVL